MMDKVGPFQQYREQLETLQPHRKRMRQVPAMTTVQNEAISNTAELVKKIKELGQALKEQL